VFLLGQILAFAIAALAYNVLLGYTGLLSFGHAAFFGGSAYAAGLAMQYYGMTELFLLIPLGVLVAGTIAVVIGFISVRHTEVYYALLMLALAHLIYVLTVKLYDHRRHRRRRDHDADHRRRQLPHGVGYAGYLMGILLRHPALVRGDGRVAVDVHALAVRPHAQDYPGRSGASAGHRHPGSALPVVREHHVRTLYRSRGVMYAFLNGHVTPGTVLHWSGSGELAFMTVLGGTGWFFGPITGAGAFILIRVRPSS